MKIVIDENFSYKDSKNINKEKVLKFAEECIKNYPNAFEFDGDKQAFIDTTIKLSVIIQKISNNEYIITEYYPTDDVIII